MSFKYEECRKKAEDSDMFAQYELAQMYQKVGDFKEAEKWYEKSANQGYAPAQKDMGAISEFGLNNNPDWDKAEYWYEKAAAQGNEEAKKALESLRKRKEENK